MKTIAQILIGAVLLAFTNCNEEDKQPTNDTPPNDNPVPAVNTNVNFQYKTTIKVGNEGACEISAYDDTTKKLFIVNVESDEISVYNIADVNAPKKETSISVAPGSPNSVAVKDGKLAIAVEDAIKQNNGKVMIYNTADNSKYAEMTVGALPDMVTFTKDGKYVLSANEGEPNDEYTVDPKGSISIIDVATKSVKTLEFDAFNSQESSLEEKGFRVFGPNADLATDVEPEYITVSDDSKTAWVSLQENNGIAKINLETQTIDALYPLGFKDYNKPGNEIDPSDKDDKKELRNVPVFGMYQPDAITSATINGVEYVFSANEGDARDYDGFSEEKRLKKLELDETVFPAPEDYLNEANLGRLKVTTTLGDANNDGKYEAIYSYGARSFSIWSTDGNLIYDSGNSIAKETLEKTPSFFNYDDGEADGRSDDKGAEPEAVEILNMNDKRYILFVGLERNNQVIVYDVTNPTAPEFLSILSHTDDKGPEGLLIIPAEKSPSGNDLLIVTNEISGTISFYENQQ